MSAAGTSSADQLAARQQRTAQVRRFMRRREPPLVIVTLLVFGVTTLLKPGFGASNNVSFMLATAMPLAVLAVGQTVVCLVRGIDLSVAPVLGIAAVSTGFLAQDHGDSVWSMIPLAIGIGIGLGFVNGLFITYARIPPIIATLGTYTVYSGVQQLICNSATVVTLPTQYEAVGIHDFIAPIPWLVIPGIVVTVVMALILRRTKWGRSLYAFGNNADASYRAGIRVNFVQLSAYTVCGTLAGLGGLVYLCKYTSAGYVSGEDISIQLQSIACVLIGGTTLTGGKGGVVGSFIAAIFLTVVLEAVIVLKINFDWENAVVGVLLLAAILVDAYQNRQGASMRYSLGRMFLSRPTARTGATS